MKTLKIAFCIMLIGLISCTRFKTLDCASGVDVSIINKSGIKQHLKLGTTQDSFIEFNIPATTTEKDTLLCFDKTPKVDGHYTLKIDNAVIDSISNFGYYTNGYPLGSKIEIVIDKESFTAKEIH
jgi:hypothetical protein